jgi:hypothetical protein
LLVVRQPHSRAAARAAYAEPELPPLLASAAESDTYTNYINELEKSLNLICESKRDPLEVADQWAGTDLDTTLDWLGRRIHAVVRARILGCPSKPVTDAANPVLHNLWAGLRLDALFKQFAAVEKLRAELDGGVNAELALRVLLMGFVAERG